MLFKDRLLLAIIPPIAYVLIKLICMTQRIRYVGLENIRKVFHEQGNAIIAFWHNRIFGIPYNYRKLFRKKKIVTLSSQSRDGEYSTRIQGWFGGETIRGSSSKGGTEALKKLVREIRSGKDCAITPDGPRGPKYAIHEGAVAVAYLAKTPIVPVSFDCTRKKILNSWDNFIVPLPFGRMVFVFGEPIYPVNEGKTLSMDELRLALAEGLENITDFAKNEITNIMTRKELKGGD
jgi:lysophospholipid acyltransferase (LPLAT)-like uncharacterized protein